MDPHEQAYLIEEFHRLPFRYLRRRIYSWHALQCHTANTMLREYFQWNIHVLIIPCVSKKMLESMNTKAHKIHASRELSTEFYNILEVVIF